MGQKIPLGDDDQLTNYVEDRGLTQSGKHDIRESAIAANPYFLQAIERIDDPVAIRQLWRAVDRARQRRHAQIQAGIYDTGGRTPSNRARGPGNFSQTSTGRGSHSSTGSTILSRG